MTELADRPVARADDSLGSTVSRLLHVFSRARSHMLDKARNDVEWSSQLLISTLATQGPMRAGALAEALESDPSTISRQVASLVREGLVQRRADPIDGRASLLVVTDRGLAAHEQHLERRDEHFRRMLRHWDEHDRAELARLIARFTDDFENYRAELGTTGTPGGTGTDNMEEKA